MSKKMASIIMGYGLLLAARGLGVRWATPEKGTGAFIVGIVGGGLSVLCGVVAWSGHRRRVWIVLTGIAVALVLLGQTVQAWMPSADKSETVAGAWLLTLMLLLTVGLLMYALHGERPPEFYSQGTARRESSPLREHAHSEAGRHQFK